jgi:hypothetical protein
VDRVPGLRHRAPARPGLLEGILQTAKADVLPLAAFEVRLFGWMALMAPVNVWVIRKGIKEAM